MSLPRASVRLGCRIRRYRRSRTRSTTKPGAAPQQETLAATGPGEAFTTRLRRRDRCTRSLPACSGRDGAALLLDSGSPTLVAHCAGRCLEERIDGQEQCLFLATREHVDLSQAANETLVLNLLRRVLASIRGGAEQ